MATSHHILLIVKILILAFMFLVVEAKNKVNKPSFDIPINGQDQGTPKPDIEPSSNGHWEVLSQNSGVSAMQINLMPTNKIVVYDATIYRISRLLYPPGVPCVPFTDDRTKETRNDCFAHSMEYDLATNQARPLKVKADPWCSCGGLAPDGTLISIGGFLDGIRTMRYYGGPACKGNDCDWREYNNLMHEDRWYGTQVILPTGDFIVVGGRRAFSYEYVPRVEGQRPEKPYFFPFLYETSDIDENNLYPFVHLSTDGNLFIFSNNRSLLLNPATNKIVRTFPVLAGGSRCYPASGMSALLPINLNTDDNKNPVKAEVIVCGGNAPDAFFLAETKKYFNPALNDCNRMVITDQIAKWEKEYMPSGRTMGDCIILPNGHLLFINGAQKGTAGWWDADSPNLTPALYNPEKPIGQRFKELRPTQISRMYHSTSALLPNGKIWIAGSNTHDTYKDVDKFPTETRVEGFSPPYLDANLDQYRPIIDEVYSSKNLRFGHKLETLFRMGGNVNNDLVQNDIKVNIYFPPFTTHGFSMSQRLVILKTRALTKNAQGLYNMESVAPIAQYAPPGFYILYVVHRGIPSKGMWVHIQ